MARGRAGAGRRLLLLLLLALLACSRRSSSAGRSSTAPQAAATRLRPAREAVALDWSAYADPQTASQRFRVRTHGPSAAFVRSSRICIAIGIAAGRRRRARGVASGGHGAGAAQGAPVRSSLLPLIRRPSLAVSGCAGAGRRKRSSSWGEAARRSSAPSAPGAAHYGPLARGRLSRGRVLTGVVRNLAQVQAHPRPANRELRRARSRQLGRRSC